MVSSNIPNCLVDIPISAMTDKMGTMFECLHRAVEDKNVGSANTDIGAEFCCVGLEHSTSRTAARRLTI